MVVFVLEAPIKTHTVLYETLLNSPARRPLQAKLLYILPVPRTIMNTVLGFRIQRPFSKPRLWLWIRLQAPISRQQPWVRTQSTRNIVKLTWDESKAEVGVSKGPKNELHSSNMSSTIDQSTFFSTKDAKRGISLWDCFYWKHCVNHLETDTEFARWII